jgi:hypothetical protein
LNPRQPDPQSGALTKLSYSHQPVAANVVFLSPAVKHRVSIGGLVRMDQVQANKFTCIAHVKFTVDIGGKAPRFAADLSPCHFRLV